MLGLHGGRAAAWEEAARTGSGTRRVLLAAAAAHELADGIADRAWDLARCGLDLDLLTDPTALLEVLGQGGAAPLRQYDALVLVVEEPLPRRAAAALIDAVAATRVLVAGPGGRNGPWSTVPATPEEGLGDGIAATLTELLRERPATPPAEDVTTHLRRVAQAASGAYGAASAMVALVGPRTVRTLVAVGPRLAPEERAACAVDRPADGPTVILDARTDPRTRGAVDPDRVRFLAAHPVEGADGSPIGTVCVFDDEPRTAADVDLEVLRDLAVLAGAEIEHALRLTRAAR